MVYRPRAELIDGLTITACLDLYYNRETYRRMEKRAKLPGLRGSHLFLHWLTRVFMYKIEIIKLFFSERLAEINTLYKALDDKYF